MGLAPLSSLTVVGTESVLPTPATCCAQLSALGTTRLLGVLDSERFVDGNIYLDTRPGADGRDYDIITYGRDNKPGGEGYDADISTSTLDQR